jgi:hypothetical protein
MMQALKKSLATRQSSKPPKIAAVAAPRQQRKAS